MNCPLTCSVVKEAMLRHDKFKARLEEFIEWNREMRPRCSVCIRNEKATMPRELLFDRAEG